MSGSIRPQEVSDYPALVAVYNAIDSDEPDTAEALRHRDSQREAKLIWRRYVYEESGSICAFAGYSQNSWMYHPRKFSILVYVHPEARRRRPRPCNTSS